MEGEYGLAGRARSWRVATAKRRAWALSRDSRQASESQDGDGNGATEDEPLSEPREEEKPLLTAEPAGRLPSKITSWLQECRTPQGTSLEEQAGTPGRVGGLKNGCSFEDDLSLGAEANHLNLKGSKAELSCSEILANERRERFQQRGMSITSSGSSRSGGTVSSVSELLDLYEEDPEETLISLGFGTEEPDISSRIPSRFFGSSSTARGIDIKVYLGAQLKRMELENPSSALTCRFQQIQVLTTVANAFNSLYSQVSGAAVSMIGGGENEPDDVSLEKRNNSAKNIARKLKLSLGKYPLKTLGGTSSAPACMSEEPSGEDACGTNAGDKPEEVEQRSDLRPPKPPKAKDLPMLATVMEEAQMNSAPLKSKADQDLPNALLGPSEAGHPVAKPSSLPVESDRQQDEGKGTVTSDKENSSFSLRPNPHMAHLLAQPRDSFELEEVQSNEGEPSGTQRAGSADQLLRMASQHSDSSGFAEEPSADTGANPLKVQKSSDSCDSETTVTSTACDQGLPLACPSANSLQAAEELLGNTHATCVDSVDTRTLSVGHNEVANSKEFPVYIPHQPFKPTRKTLEHLGGSTSEAEPGMRAEHIPEVEAEHVSDAQPGWTAERVSEVEAKSGWVGEYVSEAEPEWVAEHVTEAEAEHVTEAESEREAERVSEAEAERVSEAQPKWEAERVSEAQPEWVAEHVSEAEAERVSQAQPGWEAEHVSEAEDEHVSEAEPEWMAECVSEAEADRACEGDLEPEWEAECASEAGKPPAGSGSGHMTACESVFDAGKVVEPRLAGELPSHHGSAVAFGFNSGCIEADGLRQSDVGDALHRTSTVCEEQGALDLGKPLTDQRRYPMRRSSSLPTSLLCPARVVSTVKIQIGPGGLKQCTPPTFSYCYTPEEEEDDEHEELDSDLGEQGSDKQQWATQGTVNPSPQLEEPLYPLGVPPHLGGSTRSLHSAPPDWPQWQPCEPQPPRLWSTCSVPNLHRLASPCEWQHGSLRGTPDCSSHRASQHSLHSTPYSLPYGWPHSSLYNSPNSAPYSSPYSSPYSVPYNIPYRSPFHDPLTAPYPGHCHPTCPYGPTGTPSRPIHSPSSTEMQLRRVLHDIKSTVQSLAQHSSLSDACLSPGLNSPASSLPLYESTLQELQAIRRSLNAFRTQMMDLELALVRQQSLVYPHLSDDDSRRQEELQLQQLRDAVKQELQELELQLDDRLLSLDEQLRFSHSGSPYRRLTDIQRGHSADSLSGVSSLNMSESGSEVTRDQLGYESRLSTASSPALAFSSRSASPGRAAIHPGAEQPCLPRVGLCRASVCLTPAPPRRPPLVTPAVGSTPPSSPGKPRSTPARESTCERGGRGAADGSHLQHLIQQVKESIADEVRQEILNELLVAMSSKKSPAAAREL